MDHNYKIILFIFFIAISSSAQELYKQTILSQGTTSNLESGLIVSQSVGQESVIGNFTNGEIKIIQGFQQPLNITDDVDRIHMFDILAFPNPFLNDLNFEFENIKPSEVRVDIYDVTGRYIDSYFASDFGEILKLKLENLISTEYIFRLTGPGINYSTKIIKK